ncbi:MAG: hypothetical protein ACD_43C00120G0002, partial [uncultured bacterium]
MGLLFGIEYGTAVAINDNDPNNIKLWVVHGLIEYARVDTAHGPFRIVNTVRLPRETTEPTQQVSGEAAWALAIALDGVFAVSKVCMDLDLLPFYGVASFVLRRDDKVWA